MTGFPTVRPRRLRKSPTIRRMVRETSLSVANLIYPLFAVPGTGISEEIAAMPGVYHHSVDTLVDEARVVHDLGIPAVLLFGLPAAKDPMGSEAWSADGTVQRAVRAVKAALPNLVVITDVCLCQYTVSGHCGMLLECPAGGCSVDNDSSLDLLVKTAVSHAESGADIVAPSDMMDGRVGAIREGLDIAGRSDVAIMAYSAKYASSFYGPFREAAESAPQSGDRKSYQMDPANVDEALREVELDIGEGADIVMVKPALAYLDVIRAVKSTYNSPVAAYSVSGEYSMVKAAAEKGWVEERSVVLEMMTSIKRAGADMIITYFAKDIASWLERGNNE